MTALRDKNLLLSTVSATVLAQYVLSPYYHGTHPLYAQGIITRIYFWLRLLWHGGDAEAAYSDINQPPQNRAKKRIETRPMPKARCGNPLGPILRRVLGRARYLRFIYDDSLTGRVRWCFDAWNWRWEKRMTVKDIPLTRRKKRAALGRTCKPFIEITPD